MVLDEDSGMQIDPLEPDASNEKQEFELVKREFLTSRLTWSAAKSRRFSSQFDFEVCRYFPKMNPTLSMNTRRSEDV